MTPYWRFELPGIEQFSGSCAEYVQHCHARLLTTPPGRAVNLKPSVIYGRHGHLPELAVWAAEFHGLLGVAVGTVVRGP
jgi:hypothetical protein